MLKMMAHINPFHDRLGSLILLAEVKLPKRVVILVKEPTTIRIEINSGAGEEEIEAEAGEIVGEVGEAIRISEAEATATLFPLNHNEISHQHRALGCFHNHHFNLKAEDSHQRHLQLSLLQISSKCPPPNNTHLINHSYQPGPNFLPHPPFSNSHIHNPFKLVRAGQICPRLPL